MIYVDDVVVNPTEAETTPSRTEQSLSELGLGVIGANWGESASGQSGSEPKTRTIALDIVCREDAEVDLATAAYRLQQIVGQMQEEPETWIKRVPEEGDFAGPVMYRIRRSPTAEEPQVTLAGLGGWAAGDTDQVTLTVVADFPAYSTEEDEGEKHSTTTARQLVYTEPAAKGSTRGLRRIRVTNDNSSGDWRGLIFASECRDYSADATAEPWYECSLLTPKGGAEISASNAPEVRGMGTVAAGVGAVSPGLPAGTVAEDRLVMIGESKGTDPALTATGWTANPQGSKVQGNTRLTVLERTATGTDPTTTNDTGDHQIARIIGVKAGTFDPNAPINISASGTQAATKSVSIPGGTTTRDNCLIVAIASGSLPDATTTAEFGAATNASLTGITERIDNTTAEGDGGAIYAVTGVKATKGVYSATTCTAVTEAERGVISLAINPYPEYIQHTGLTAGWQSIMSTLISASSLHMTHRGGRRVWIRANDPVGSNNIELRLFWRALGSSNWTEDNPIAPVYASGGWRLVDLRSVLPQAPALGDGRWEGKVLARALNGSGTIRLRDFYPLPTEQYSVIREPKEGSLDGLPVKLPGTVADAAGVGTVTWSNPGNAKIEDGSRATAKLGTGVVSHYLKATNFGFAIPPGSDIAGIGAVVRRRCETNGVIYDKRVRIVKGGVIKEAQDKANLQTAWWLPFGTSYGGQHDLWGESWTASDINASEFGIALAAEHIGGSGEPLAEVDVIELLVAYYESGGASSLCFASRAIELRSDGAFRQALGDDVWGSQVPDGFLPYATPGSSDGLTQRTILYPLAGRPGNEERLECSK